MLTASVLRCDHAADYSCCQLCLELPALVRGVAGSLVDQVPAGTAGAADQNEQADTTTATGWCYNPRHATPCCASTSVHQLVARSLQLLRCRLSGAILMGNMVSQLG